MAKDFSSSPHPPYTIGMVNNNPGNLRPGDSWQGMVGTNGGFVKFQDMSYGIRALGTDITNKISRGLNTITKIISVYAPPSENNTDAYIDAVSDSTGIPATAPLTLDNTTLKKLVRAIITHENGADYADMITDADIDEGLSKMSANIISKIKNFFRTTRK